MIKTLGNHLWGLLHNFADTYPESPTDEDKIMAENFIDGFSNMVLVTAPLCDCGVSWLRILRMSPAPVDNRDSFYEWTVLVHDIVNEKVGNPIFNPESESHPLFISMKQIFSMADGEPFGEVVIPPQVKGPPPPHGFKVTKMEMQRSIQPAQVKMSEEEIESRKAICSECPFFDAQQQRCEKCGCAMNLKFKQSTGRCPIGKW